MPPPPYLSPPHFGRRPGSLSTLTPAPSHQDLWERMTPGPSLFEACGRSPPRDLGTGWGGGDAATASLSTSLSEENISETAPFQRQ